MLEPVDKYLSDRQCEAWQATQESFFHVAQRSCRFLYSALRPFHPTFTTPTLSGIDFFNWKRFLRCRSQA